MGLGADIGEGDAGADRLLGLAGEDDLSGGTGDDELDGGTGDDELRGEAGADDLDGEVAHGVAVRGCPGKNGHSSKCEQRAVGREHDDPQVAVLAVHRVAVAHEDPRHPGVALDRHHLARHRERLVRAAAGVLPEAPDRLQAPQRLLVGRRQVGPRRR